MSLLLFFGGSGAAPSTICLWNRIDTYLQEQLTARLGAGGDYSTLTLATVAVGETLDIDHVTLPYCLVRGVDVRYDSEGVHGDTEVHFDNIQYPYVLILVSAAATAAGANSNAKELLRRVREWLRGDFWLTGLQDDDGETVVRVDVGDPSVGVEGLGGQNRGQYVGWVRMPLTIISEV